MLLLDRGADPSIAAHGRSATAMAAWEGRGDVLRVFQERRVPLDLNAGERLLAACATDDADAVRGLAGDSTAVRDVLAQQGAVLGEFAGVGNTAGIRHLLGLGADVAAMVDAGDGYWGRPAPGP